ncbi:MAG: ubiquinol-cytochrome c reductase iron-sulfur subunit [Georgfuchsia sp.]
MKPLGIDDALDPDADRRRLLLAATSVVGCAGLLAAAYPFVASMEPSARALAAAGPVGADAGKVAAGELMTVAWRGKPVWIMRRTPEMIQALRQPNPHLADPQSKQSVQPVSCDNALRSVRPELFVAVGICTHLGCSPVLRLDDDALKAELHAPGGFLCPCHGSRFDLAGRVLKNVPAPTNLLIPDYRFTGNDKLIIG